jgi:hypothetical protein
MSDQPDKDTPNQEEPMDLLLPTQKPAVALTDLIVYLDQEGKRFYKAAAIPGMTGEELMAAHREVQDLLGTLKAKRDMLTKQSRRRLLPNNDTRPLQRTKRWLKKAGALNVLLEHELHRRKRRQAAALAETFVQEARRLLTPEQFDAVLLAAIQTAGQ